MDTSVNTLQLNQHCRRLSHTRGFSLVELMVAVVLIGVMAGFATPAIMRGMERARAKAVARDIANVFRLARNQAMNRGEVILAVVSTANSGNITLYRSTNAAASCAAATFNTADAATVLQTLPLVQRPGNLFMVGITPANEGTATNPLCFAPGGKVVKKSGLPITNLGDCSRFNFRVAIAKKDWSGDVTLGNCLSASATDTDRRSLKDRRDINNYYIVHVPFNGTIDVIQ